MRLEFLENVSCVVELGMIHCRIGYYALYNWVFAVGVNRELKSGVRCV